MPLLPLGVYLGLTADIMTAAMFYTYKYNIVT